MYDEKRYKESSGNIVRSSEVSSIAPIAAVSFLWSEMEQKDLAESGTGVF